MQPLLHLSSSKTSSLYRSNVKHNCDRKRYCVLLEQRPTGVWACRQINTPSKWFLMQWFPLAFCMIVFRHTVGLLWTGDKPVSETSTCTGQHTTKRPQTYALDRAATEVDASRLHSAISQKTLIFILIALKTWNLTSKRLSGTSSGTTLWAYVLRVDARVLDAGSLSFCNWCVDNVKGSWRYCGLITSARMCERHGVALETPLAAERWRHVRCMCYCHSVTDVAMEVIVLSEM
jgi:hypothetical protein